MVPRIVLQIPYDPICDAARTHPLDVLYFLIAKLVTHIPVGVLTVAKWHLVKIRIPVVRLVTRDGTLTAVSVCSLNAAVIYYAIFSRAQTHIVFNWPITFLSIACCRVIMNMQTLNVPGNQDITTNSLSTVNFELDSMDAYHLNENFIETPT